MYIHVRAAKPLHPYPLTQTYAYKHTHTHTHKRIQTHTVLYLLAANTGHVGLSGRWEERFQRYLGKMTQLAIEPPNGRNPPKSLIYGWTGEMIPFMGSPYLSKWVRTMCRKGLTASEYSSQDPTAFTPIPSEGNTCYCTSRAGG